jgi:hypothetical protein
LKDFDAEAVIDALLDSLTVAAFRQEAAQLPIPEHTIDDVAKIIEGNRSRLKK